jgi:hypothetical protein
VTVDYPEATKKGQKRPTTESTEEVTEKKEEFCPQIAQISQIKKRGGA